MKTEILKKLSENGFRWVIKSNTEKEITASLNNFHQENFLSLDEALEYLKDLVLENYPESEFADWWRQEYDNKRVMYGS